MFRHIAHEKEVEQRHFYCVGIMNVIRLTDEGVSHDVSAAELLDVFLCGAVSDTGKFCGYWFKHFQIGFFLSVFFSGPLALI